jgi:hypothetical protein
MQMIRPWIGAALSVLAVGVLPATAAAQAPAQPTLNLTLGAAPVFAPFIPGVGTAYTATSTGVVNSSSADTILTVADPSAVASGHLLNGNAPLPAALQVSGASANGTSSGFQAVPDTAAPATLLTYAGPVSDEQVTLTFKQTVAQTDALRTGSYTKTLVFTLSTDQP